jgi:anti-sigma-K factor RskA
MTNGDPFRELAQAYALDALDAQERTTLEAHLATGCTTCAKEIEEARWLVSQLAYLAPPAEPSNMLRDRLLRTIREEANPQQASAKTAIPFWVWSGVAALLIVTVGLSWYVRRLQENIQQVQERAAREVQLREKLQKEWEVAKHEAIILTDPDSKKITMAPTNPQMPKLEAMWHPQLGLFVMGHKVPLPAGNRVLQLWLIPKAPSSKPMPSMTLRPDSEGKFVLMVENPPELMTDTKALAITEEPEGGSSQPTSKPVWVGGIS